MISQSAVTMRELATRENDGIRVQARRVAMWADGKG
jgi:hypothetical protein